MSTEADKDEYTSNKYGIDLVNWLFYCLIDNFKIRLKAQETYEREREKIDTCNRDPLYAIAISIALTTKVMNENNMLYREYSKKKVEALPYVCGVIDVNKSAANNSLAHGMLYQSHRVRSIDTPLHRVISFCIRHSLIYVLDLRRDNAIIRDIDNYFYGDDNIEKKGLFTEFNDGIAGKSNDKLKEIINRDLGFINRVNGEKSYETYQPVITLCKMYLEGLKDKSEGKNGTTVFSWTMHKIFELVLETAVFHNMLYFESLPEYKGLKNNWHMYQRDKRISGDNADVVVTQKISSIYRGVYFDSKAYSYESYRDKQNDNLKQVSFYTDQKYGTDSDNHPGVSIKRYYGVDVYFMNESGYNQISRYERHIYETQGFNTWAGIKYSELFMKVVIKVEKDMAPEAIEEKLKKPMERMLAYDEKAGIMEKTRGNGEN